MRELKCNVKYRWLLNSQTNKIHYLARAEALAVRVRDQFYAASPGSGASNLSARPDWATHPEMIFTLTSACGSVFTAVPSQWPAWEEYIEHINALTSSTNEDEPKFMPSRIENSITLMPTFSLYKQLFRVLSAHPHAAFCKVCSRTAAWKEAEDREMFNSYLPTSQSSLI